MQRIIIVNGIGRDITYSGLKVDVSNVPPSIVFSIDYNDIDLDLINDLKLATNISVVFEASSTSRVEAQDVTNVTFTIEEGNNEIRGTLRIECGNINIVK